MTINLGFSGLLSLLAASTFAVALAAGPALAQGTGGGTGVTDCAKTPHNADCHAGPTAGHLNHDAAANKPNPANPVTSGNQPAAQAAPSTRK